MRRVLARWVAALIPTLLIASFIVFGLLHLIPGDPALAVGGREASDEQLAEIREELGLDRPFLVQYASWLGNAVRGDLGESLYNNEPVVDVIARRLPATLQIVLTSIVLSLLIGVPLGIAAAVHRRKVLGPLINGGSTLGIAVPNFWLAMVLVFIVSLRFGWLPATGYSGITSGVGPAFRATILPALALAASGVAEVTKHVRSAMIEVLQSDFIRTARSKGLRRRTILIRHGLRNAGVPIITVVGLLANRLIGATVVVETIFAIPGAGTMIVSAVDQRDYVVIQGMTLALVVIVISVNSVIDLLYRVIDPRVRT